MQNIKHKILVLSGKGGVGKSTIAANLALWLTTKGKNVGLLDIDIHGPSIPKLLNLEDKSPTGTPEQITPIPYNDTLKVMSIGFLLPDENNPVIWRGPMKHNLIKQFVSNVTWGNLDYLVVDCPPGTGDEPLSIAQLIPSVDGAIIVTTPQQLAILDVKKCITFCRRLNLHVLGIIENMAGFVCPNCGKKTDIFSGNGGQQLATNLNIPFLGQIPLDPYLVLACDTGKPIIKSDTKTPAMRAMQNAFEPLLREHEKTSANKEVQEMRIAIPITDGKLSAHFGHCQQFAVIDADPDTKTITNTEMFTPPAHEPGALPRWLGGLCVNTIIAGGMGQRAQQLFAQNNIDIVVGAPDETPEQLVENYLSGQLQTGQNICDH